MLLATLRPLRPSPAIYHPISLTHSTCDGCGMCTPGQCLATCSMQAVGPWQLCRASAVAPSTAAKVIIIRRAVAEAQRHWFRKQPVISPATIHLQRNAPESLVEVTNMLRAPPRWGGGKFSRRLSPRISGTPHHRRPWNTPFAALSPPLCVAMYSISLLSEQAGGEHGAGQAPTQ